MKATIGVKKLNTVLGVLAATIIMVLAMTMSKTAFACSECDDDWVKAKHSCYTQRWVPGAYGVQGHYETIPCYGNYPTVQKDGPSHCYTKHHKHKCKHYEGYDNYYHR